MLKVGELAARVGMTVRALHHYDSIGLLVPSARSDAGYRLYDRNDVARLHQIQALRKFGMALADIGAYLASPEASPISIVVRQIALLDRQIGEAARMRDTLLALHAQLANGEAPELATWLTTLEQMTMYEKYFSKEELQQLPIYQNKDAEADWQQLVAQANGLMAASVPVHDEAAKALARRWMDLLERDTAGNPAFMAQLNAMHENEPSVQRDTGISMQLKGYIMRAIGEVKLDVYAKYLTVDEIGRMRRHHENRVREWPALIESVKAQMRADPSTDAPRARALAAQWFELFQDMVGTDPGAVARFRKAVESEPVLQMGRGMTDEMIGFLRRARENA
jgi:DNA-binding transcriptional MerR regulator